MIYAGLMDPDLHRIWEGIEDFRALWSQYIMDSRCRS